jgi:cob(I)alamin adenosyltransferase
MNIYTKTGDKGETGLFGAGRVSKDSLRIEAYGTVDELNSFIGLAVVESDNSDVKKMLKEIQNMLFVVGSDLASPNESKSGGFAIPRVEESHSERVEKFIDEMSEQLEELRFFILPGGTKAASVIHIARTVCRRAERKVVALNKQEIINKNIIIFLNRISDFLFVLARFENKLSGVQDVQWEK